MGIFRASGSKRLAVATSTLALAVSVLVATPATAAMDSNCGLNVSTPRTDGTYVYSTSTVSCTTYQDYTAVQAGNRIQESAAGVWLSRTGWNYTYSAGTTYLTANSVYNCNGHGTDSWRANGMGKTSDGGVTNLNSSQALLTC